MAEQNTQVSVVIPTLNEAKNIAQTVEKIAQALAKHYQYEIIVADDSSQDQTLEIVDQLRTQFPVRGLDRKGQPKSLSQSVMAGFFEGKGDVLVVMDADLSHPTESLPQMIDLILSNQADIVVGSRYIAGGGCEGWPWHRQAISRGAAMLTYGLTSLTDPTSGFMAIRKELIHKDLKPLGWKIVLECVAKNLDKKIVEVPIIFKDRQLGESKFRFIHQIQFLMHLVKLYGHKYESLAEFIKFSIVGASGVLIDATISILSLQILHLSYSLAACAGFSFALISNYVINRLWSFKHARQHPVLRSFVSYLVVNGVGFLSRLAFIEIIIHLTPITHPIILTLTGIAIASVVNFFGIRYFAFFKK